MIKRLVALAMTAAIAVGIVLSGQSTSASAEPFKLNGDPKIAWIYFSEVNDGGWTQAIDEARQRMESDLGLEITWVEKIPEVASQVTNAADPLSAVVTILSSAAPSATAMPSRHFRKNTRTSRS